MAVNPNLLLYIEPINSPSKEPVIDALTRKMTAAFRKSVKGVLPKYDTDLNGKNFKEGGGWMGWHTCSCNSWSEHNDYLLPNGEVTNSLCIHYLAFHRDEVSQEQLDRVRALNEGEEEPNVEELNEPEEEKKFDGFGSRAKYKAELAQK